MKKNQMLGGKFHTSLAREGTHTQHFFFATQKMQLANSYFFVSAFAMLSMAAEQPATSTAAATAVTHNTTSDTSATFARQVRHSTACRLSKHIFLTFLN